MANVPSGLSTAEISSKYTHPETNKIHIKGDTAILTREKSLRSQPSISARCRICNVDSTKLRFVGYQELSGLFMFNVLNNNRNSPKEKKQLSTHLLINEKDTYAFKPEEFKWV